MITYRLAIKEDNQQLLELTAATGMTGQTGLRIDRHPDFFKLLEKRGESKVIVALDGNKIVGSLCVSLQRVWVSDQIVPLHYIGDFKVAPTHRNMGIGLQLCNELANEIVPRGADLAFLNVSKGNSKPFSFFKNRPSIPDFDNIGIFKIHQFVGRRKRNLFRESSIQETMADEDLLSFLNRHYSQYAMGPVITSENLKDTQIFIIRDNTRIIAAMCLSDTMNMKQNIVLKLDPKLKWTMRILDSFSDLIGFSKMPSLN
ncbi:MAG TPA: GNAT family N-acetyltransferase, partial [Chitinophagaceae bacterium]